MRKGTEPLRNGRFFDVKHGHSIYLFDVTEKQKIKQIISDITYNL